MMKYAFFIFIFSLFGLLTVQGQFTKADIGVNGLTCSQCSRSVEMSLKRLTFVASVSMDLQDPTAHVIFKRGAAIDPDKLAAAITDAGFAVRDIKVRYEFKEPTEDACFIYDKRLYYPVNKSAAPQKSLALLLLGKGMISDTELKKYKNDNWLKEPECTTTMSKRIPFLIIN